MQGQGSSYPLSGGPDQQPHNRANRFNSNKCELFFFLLKVGVLKMGNIQLNKTPKQTLQHVHTYQNDTHHNNDHSNNSSEGNKVVREWKSKLRLEDHIRPAGQEEKQQNSQYVLVHINGKLTVKCSTHPGSGIIFLRYREAW